MPIFLLIEPFPSVLTEIKGIKAGFPDQGSPSYCHSRELRGQDAGFQSCRSEGVFLGKSFIDP